MLRGDPRRDVFKVAAEPTLARIRRDRARAPRVLKRVFTVVAGNLFHPSLNATEAWRDAGIRDRALGAVFKDFTATSLGRYIAAARVEVANVLMAITDLDLATISERVGYIYHPTFTENYKRLKGKLPSEVARKLPAPPLIEDERSLEAGRGLLDPAAMVRHIEDLLRICPAAAKYIRVGTDKSDPEPRIMVDGARGDRLQAEELWREIRDLPFADQRRRVRRYLFSSTVLFDLLREKSRWEGHTNHRRGVELARLALVSLEDSDRVFGERIHDLRAFGWAWLGNAYRLALDFSAAAAAFEQADRAWSEPRAQRNQLVLGNICHLKGAWRMVQREYVEGTHDLDRACSLFRLLGQERDEARSLIYRATIHTYAGKLSEAVRDFHEAASLIDEDQEKEMAFAIQGNLAAVLVRAGKAESAAKELNHARQLNRHIDDPLGAIKLDWIEGDLGELHGDLERAKSFYEIVRAGFRDAEEPRYLGMASVDLMTIHAQKGEWEAIAALAAETLPILNSLSLHSETLAAVGLLAEAVETHGLSRRLLKDLRVALRQDPLAM